MKTMLKESCINYLQVTGRPSCGQEIVAIAAVDTIDIKHWFHAICDSCVDSYAAMNPL